MINSLLTEYNRYHPEFLDSLTIFPIDIKERIVRRLKNENDKNNFLSTIAEIRFGKLFSELGFEIEYDKTFPNNQKPDWEVKLGESTAICDVYRLGKSEKDQFRSDFENLLMEKIQEIPQSVCLKIDFKDAHFDTALYDIDSITENVKDWLMGSPRETGERITVSDNFEFIIFISKTKWTNVSCIGNGSPIEIKPHKVRQSEDLKPNEITKKLHKYDQIISDRNMPFFICVYIDFESGFDHGDFRSNFLGRGNMFDDFGTPLANMDQFRHLGQTWTDLGEFYNNLQLSGIITFRNQKFRLLLNPNKGQIIYEQRNLEMLGRLKTILNDTNAD